MLKKLSYRFFILFLISCICLNTYTYTKSEAADFGVSTAIQYFVDFAVSYLGYSANKQDRLSIANQLIQTYSSEKEKLYDFSKKLIFASWSKTLNFLGNKVGAFENDMKRYLTYVKSLLFNRDDYIVNDKISDFSSDYFIINGVSKRVNYKINVVKNYMTLPLGKLKVKGYNDLSGKTFYLHDCYTSEFDSNFNKHFNKDLRITFLGGYHYKVFYNNRSCFETDNNVLTDTISTNYGKCYLQPVNLNFNIDNINYSVTEYINFTGSGEEILYNKPFQDYLSYFFRNSIIKSDKRSLSKTLNPAPAVKTIVKNIDLTSKDYNIIVDKVLEKLPNLENYVGDTTNEQLLNYASDGVINREIDKNKTLTGSDIVNLNVDKLLENTASIDADVKANSSLLKNIYDVVSNSRESILKLASDLALTNTKALNLSRDIADIKAKTDVISSDTYADTLSDSISTSVSKSIDATISKTIDQKLGDTKDKHLDLKPLQNLIIKDKFPFCLPFDLKNSLVAMRSKQIIPNFKLTIRGYSTNIDFSMFDSLVKKARPFFLLMFVIFLILVTKKIIS